MTVRFDVATRADLQTVVETSLVSGDVVYVRDSEEHFELARASRSPLGKNVLETRSGVGRWLRMGRPPVIGVFGSDPAIEKKET